MTSFGSPSKGGKFYTGSKHSNLWVKDLLWARYCVKEGKSYGLEDIKPPMMNMYRGDSAMVDKEDRLPQVHGSSSSGGDDSVRVAQLEAALRQKTHENKALRQRLQETEQRAERAETAASRSNLILRKLRAAIDKKRHAKMKRSTSAAD